MKSQRWEWFTFICAIGFYGTFALHAHRPPDFNAPRWPVETLFFACLLFLGIGLSHLPIKHWIYLLTCLVPLEVSAPLRTFPILSPIDYLCAVTSLLLFFRWGVRS